MKETKQMKRQKKELQEPMKESKKEESGQSGNFCVSGQRTIMGLVYKENQQNLESTRLECAFREMQMNSREIFWSLGLVQNEQPLLISITDVKPKYSIDKLFPAKFSIEHIGNYDSPFHRNIVNNIGRGILLYTHRSLHAKK